MLMMQRLVHDDENGKVEAVHDKIVVMMLMLCQGDDDDHT